MLSADKPVFVPIAMPSDAPVLAAAPPQAAIMLSAVYGSNPRLAELIAVARRRTSNLLVDPKTPHFQFEGYMSMPDYRALPYSPGRHTLGTLWEPARFARPEARRELIDAVFEAQRRLGADLLLAPYFYVRHAAHPWLQTARECAAEALEAAAPEPVGVPVCVDIDALLDPAQRDRIGAAYTELPAAMYWLTVVNFDERRADPRDAAALLAFLELLRASGRPVILAHAGRSGLLAIAAGAAGYGAGTHGLEHHPRQHFREMIGTRPANRYYLHECFMHLPVRTAEAAIGTEEPVGHPSCECAACADTDAISLMVSRRLALHSLLHRLREVVALAAVPPAARRAWLVERFTEALSRSAALAAALENGSGAQIEPGDYHYLEVLREAAGGPAATRPVDDELD
jgi:hypothetical protein